jgi:hypothetical protein
VAETNAKRETKLARMTKRGIDVELACRCGQVHGTLRGSSPSSLNRSVCYCRDCQAYLHRLLRTDLLDDFGGTELVQVAPAAVSFDRGDQHIRGLRLSPTGMYRWYSTCCNTPLGNTLEPKVPFIGIQIGLLRGAPDDRTRDAILGKIRARFQTETATSEVEPERKLVLVRMGLHLVRLLASWKLRGRGFPNPFFDVSTKLPRFPVDVLSVTARDALRPLTGPGARARIAA